MQTPMMSCHISHTWWEWNVNPNDIMLTWFASHANPSGITSGMSISSWNTTPGNHHTSNSMQVLRYMLMPIFVGTSIKLIFHIETWLSWEWDTPSVH